MITTSWPSLRSVHAMYNDLCRGNDRTTPTSGCTLPLLETHASELYVLSLLSLLHFQSRQLSLQIAGHCWRLKN